LTSSLQAPLACTGGRGFSNRFGYTVRSRTTTKEIDMAKTQKLVAAVIMGRRGGSRSSEAKTAAARLNGKKGGPPRKDPVKAVRS